MIDAKLEICTVYKGIPYGPALISYYDKKDEFESFSGIGNFLDGQLHMTPFTCITDEGERYQHCTMINGRPEEKGFATFFNDNEDFIKNDSMRFNKKTAGWCYYIG